jgi:hypothetical protein
MRPEVEERETEERRVGRVALSVLWEHRRSMSLTILKALGMRAVMGPRQFPAAPALEGGVNGWLPEAEGRPCFATGSVQL